MTNILNFPTKAKTPATDDEEIETTLSEAIARHARGELHGLILIECAPTGERYSIVGSCANRLQYGVLAALKATNIIADKIASSGSAGRTSSPPLREDRAALPSMLLDTNFGRLR